MLAAPAPLRRGLQLGRWSWRRLSKGAVDAEGAVHAHMVGCVEACRGRAVSCCVPKRLAPQYDIQGLSRQPRVRLSPMLPCVSVRRGNKGVAGGAP